MAADNSMSRGRSWWVLGIVASTVVAIICAFMFGDFARAALLGYSVSTLSFISYSNVATAAPLQFAIRWLGFVAGGLAIFVLPLALAPAFRWSRDSCLSFSIAISLIPTFFDSFRKRAGNKR